ncbi:MFS transporter [Fundidesulfovibrio butyratiphilus]
MTRPPNASAGPEHGFCANPWACLAVSCTGTFMATLDGGIVNVALPVVAKDFGVHLPQAQWVVSAYFLCISCLLPAFGRLGDMYGRRGAYRLGFLVFAAASALCGLAHGIWWLVGARVVQAVGAALLMANGPAIVMMSFPGPTRGRAMGTIGMVVSLGSLAGPALGGLLMGLWGWPMLFFLNLPIGLAGAALSHVVLPDDRRSAPEPFDFVGALIYAAGMVSLLLVAGHGGEWGWSSPRTLTACVVAGCALALFLRRQARAESPLVDLSLFRIRPLALGNLASLLCFMALFANIILLPFLLTNVVGMTAADTGLVLAMHPLVTAVVAPLAGLASEKAPASLLTAGGLIVLAGALYAQTLLGPHATFWRAALGQACVGLGAGVFMAPNNSAVLGSAPRSKSGVAGSLMALVRNLGMVCGVALATAVFEQYRQTAVLAGLGGQSAFLSGFSAALTAAAGLALAGAALSGFRGGGE